MKHFRGDSMPTVLLYFIGARDWETKEMIDCPMIADFGSKKAAERAFHNMLRDGKASSPVHVILPMIKRRITGEMLNKGIDMLNAKKQREEKHHV